MTNRFSKIKSNSLFKRSLFLGVWLLVGVAQICAATEYYEDMVQSGEVQVDAQGFLCCLDELDCYSCQYLRLNADAAGNTLRFDQLVKFFADKGFDLNQCLSLQDLQLYGASMDIMEFEKALGCKFFFPRMTLLKFAIANSLLLKAFIKYGADIEREGFDLLLMAAENYINLPDTEHDHAEFCLTEGIGCLCPRGALQVIYRASNEKMQQQFVEKYPELVGIVQE